MRSAFALPAKWIKGAVSDESCAPEGYTLGCRPHAKRFAGGGLALSSMNQKKNAQKERKAPILRPLQIAGVRRHGFRCRFGPPAISHSCSRLDGQLRLAT